MLFTGLILSMFISVKSSNAQSNADTLAPQVVNLKDRISGVEERIANAESDLAKLIKIKIFGYI